MSPRFEVELDQETYSPGETIKGTVRISEGGSSRKLEAVLEYMEEVTDYLEVATRISSGPLQSGELVAGTSLEFELQLPQDALPNYRSEHGELYWELDVKSDELGLDKSERRRIDVQSPSTRPVEGPLGPAFPSVRGERNGSPMSLDSLGGALAPGRLGRLRFGWWWAAFMAVGVVCLGVGAWLLVDTVQFVATAESATGTVIDLSGETNSEGDEIFYPVVRFTTSDGQEIQFESSSGSSPPSHSPGDRVDVLYDPDDPDDAQLSGFFDLWFFVPIPFLIGAAFIGVGWFMRRRHTEL